MAREKRTKISTDWVDDLRAVQVDPNSTGVKNPDLVPAAILTDAEGRVRAITRAELKREIEFINAQEEARMRDEERQNKRSNGEKNSRSRCLTEQEFVDLSYVVRVCGMHASSHMLLDFEIRNVVPRKITERERQLALEDPKKYPLPKPHELLEFTDAQLEAIRDGLTRGLNIADELQNRTRLNKQLLEHAKHVDAQARALAAEQMRLQWWLTPADKGVTDVGWKVPESARDPNADAGRTHATDIEQQIAAARQQGYHELAAALEGQRVRAPVGYTPPGVASHTPPAEPKWPDADPPAVDAVDTDDATEQSP